MKIYYVINNAIIEKFGINTLNAKIYCGSDYCRAKMVKAWWARRGTFPEIITVER